MGPRELGKRHVRDTRDENRGQVVAGVAVRPVRARCEIQRPLAADDVEHVRVCVGTGRSRPAGDALDAAPVAQAAGVVQQVANCERDSVVGHFGDVLADGIVQRELAVASDCFDTDPASKIVSGVIATSCSRSAMP
jgi:hypothetical protein